MEQRRRFTGGGVALVTYTIYSNCEGADVSFDDNYVGSISNGSLSVGKEPGTYRVSISGWGRSSDSRGERLYAGSTTEETNIINSYTTPSINARLYDMSTQLTVSMQLMNNPYCIFRYLNRSIPYDIFFERQIEIEYILPSDISISDSNPSATMNYRTYERIVSEREIREQSGGAREEIREVICSDISLTILDDVCYNGSLYLSENKSTSGRPTFESEFDIVLNRDGNTTCISPSPMRIHVRWELVSSSPYFVKTGDAYYYT